MTSGYEKSGDYGGEPPNRWNTLGAILVFGCVMLWCAIVFGIKPAAKDCWTLGQDEITVTEVNGKQRATLDLRRIPKGECVTIDTGH